MRAVLIVVTGIAVAAWGVVAASSLAEVSVDVAAVEAPVEQPPAPPRARRAEPDHHRPW